MKEILKPLQRDLAIAGGIMVALLAGILIGARGCQSGVLGSFDPRIVNDTKQTVQVQPCWDPQCLDTHGMPAAVLHPGASTVVADRWPNDIGGVIVIDVQKPGAKRWQIGTCIVGFYAPGQKAGTVRVSKHQACPKGGG